MKKRIPRLFFLLVVLSCLISTNALAANVYVMSTGNAAGDSALINTLTSFGHTPTLGVQKQNFDGTQSLAGYGVVLLTDSYNWTVSGMPATGQTALLSYVNNGGGLITSEWTLWAGGQFGIIAAAFPAVYGGTYTNAALTTYSINVADPVMDFNLPASFTFNLTNLSGTESRVVANLGATIFFDSSNYGTVGVAGWDYGLGRVLNFSTLIATTELGDVNYQQLLSNAVNWSNGVVVPLPGALVLLASGLLGLGLLKRR